MTTDKSIRNAMWAPDVWELRESESQHGKWALRTGEATIRFFTHKCDAEAFWDDARDAHHKGETMTQETLAPGWFAAPFNTGTSLQSRDWPGVHIVTARRTGYDVPPSFLTGEKVVVWMLHESGETHRTAYDSLDDALAEFPYIEQGLAD